MIGISQSDSERLYWLSQKKVDEIRKLSRHTFRNSVKHTLHWKRTPVTNSGWSVAAPGGLERFVLDAHGFRSRAFPVHSHTSQERSAGIYRGLGVWRVSRESFTVSYAPCWQSPFNKTRATSATVWPICRKWIDLSVLWLDSRGAKKMLTICVTHLHNRYDISP